MALEMGSWRADGDKLARVTPTPLGIESNPSILGQTLLIIGRQVAASGGGFAAFGLED